MDSELPSPLDELSSPGRFGTGDLLPLTTLVDRYVVLEKIAQGGMGAVYQAQDRRLQKKIVAVKEMSESAVPAGKREQVLEAFQREAKLLATLDHPNLVKVTDCFQKEERYYMVMEFIEGRTLDDMLEGRIEPFPQERVLSWAEQLCDVLAYLHSRNPKIIYRDVKPANVMVGDESAQIKLIDFGISRFYKPGKKKDTLPFGTDGYAPPEQYSETQTDERADIYALGAMLHQLLTLRDPVTKPFDFPPVCRLNPEVSPGVEDAIAKAVKGPRKRRYQSIEEMRDALLLAEDEVEEAGRSADIMSLDLGEVEVASGTRDYGVTIDSPAGKKTALSTDVPWLDVHPRSVSKKSGQVTVTLDTGRLPSGHLRPQGGLLKRWVGWHTRFLVPDVQVQRGRLEVRVKGASSRYVSVSVRAVPRRWRVYFGWMMTVLVLMIEVFVGLGILAGIAVLIWLTAG